MSKNQKSSIKEDSSSIAIFLIFECVALLCFCLGGISTIFHYVGFAVAIFSFIFSYKNFDKKELSSLLLIGIPVLIIGVCCGFGKLFGGFNNFASNFAVFLAIPSFFLLGLVARRTKGFNVGTAFLCMGVGAALLVLISLFSTWIQYGFFYTLLYKNTPNYYYNGGLYSVVSEMSWLNGLSLTEVSLNYGGLFGVCLCAAIPALLFISPKEQTKKFVITAAIGLVGLLSIVTLVNITALIFLIPILLICVIYKFLTNSKKSMFVLKIVLLVFAGLICLFLLIATLNAIIPGLRTFTSSNGLLDRVFNSNRVMRPFNDVISASVKPFNLFGFPLYDAGDIEMKNESIIYENTGNFALEITKEGGIFALISLLIVVVVSVISMIKYLGKSKDSKPIKVAFLSLMITFLLYASFNWDIMPFTHQSDYVSVGRSFPFIIILFVAGLTYYPVLMKDEPIFQSLALIKEEKKIEKTVKYVDEDYVFTSDEGETTDEK